MSDHRERLAVIVALSEAFNAPLSDAALELYLDALSDVPLDALAHAARKCMRECRFLPRAAELREAAGMGRVSRDDAAIRAWTEAWAAVHDHGAHASVTFSDATTARVIVAMGGWPAFCHPTQELEWHRKEFLEQYRGLAGVYNDGPTTLPGIHGRDPANRKFGHAIEPMRIGAALPTKQIESSDHATDAPVDEETARKFMGEIRRRLAGLVTR